MRVILVDDEPIASEVLESIINTYDDVKVLKKYIDPELALKEVDVLKPDVIFLDIEMGTFNGLEMSNKFLEKVNSEIVFVTAYSQYAVEAFELNAIDYLLKPIQEKRLYKTINRLREKVQTQCIDEYNDGINKDLVIVKSFGGLEVTDNSGNPLIWRTQKAKELFTYLWFQREKPVLKVNIIENIFSDKDIEKAMTHLHTTVYQIRKGLEKIGYSNGIIYQNDSYQLNIPIRSDIDDVDKILKLKSHSAMCISKLLNIYEGDFLEYDSYFWALSTQQVYKEKVYNVIGDYVNKQLKSRQVNSLIILCLETMEKIDPFNDITAKTIIKYYGIQNMKSSLEKYYKNYTIKLWNEMGLKPMLSISRMYDEYMERVM